VGDRDWIVQVLSNLLGNAIKFTNQGGISINLFEKIQDEGERKKGILVTVPDTDNAIIVKFLQGYFQNLLKSYRGTGLGLLICKSIIDA
jgi:signal transduction histidine kinase